MEIGFKKLHDYFTDSGESNPIPFDEIIEFENLKFINVINI